LQEVDPFKVTRQDVIPSGPLKEMSCELAPSLTLIFKPSIHQGNLPSDCFGYPIVQERQQK